MTLHRLCNQAAHLLLGITAIACISFPVQAEKRDAPWVGKQLDGSRCKNTRLVPGGGPYDYRNHVAKKHGNLAMVEGGHFTENVEKLIKGRTGPLMADIDFVIRAYPNHPRALNSATQYSLRLKRWPKDAQHGLPAECYLQRAMNYTPLDPIPYRLYGYYMHKKGKLNEALAAYKRAINFSPSDPMLRYNTALILVELKKYKQAMTFARPLYDAGLTLPALRNKLKAAGHWVPSEKEIAAEKAMAEKRAKAMAELENEKASKAQMAKKPKPKVSAKDADKPTAAREPTAKVNSAEDEAVKAYLEAVAKAKAVNDQ